MKVGLIAKNGGTAVAVLADGQWIDFTAACRAARKRLPTGSASSIRGLIDVGKFNARFFSQVLGILREENRLQDCLLPGEPQFLLPLRPGKILALGRNYRAHAEETGHNAPTEPIVFGMAPSACIGPGEAIIIREYYGRVDHECELAVVIGRRAKDLKPKTAKDYIAGYTILQDVSARDLQNAAMKQGYPWFISKSIDTFCPMGPVVALPDALPWPVTVDIELKVNGQTRQRGNTADFLFSIPDVLAYITKYITLEPGDVLTTGTPEGIASIRPGDTVEITIPEIGTLRNPVAAG